MPRKKDKFLIVLDLDETLIHSLKDNEEGYDPAKMEYVDMDKYFRVFFRPYYRVFLQFLFKNYNVGVWSAGTKSYVQFIVKYLEKMTGQKFKFVWTVEECKKSIDKYNVTKALELLDKYPEVIIIDDNVEIKNKYPKQAITIRPYNEIDYDEELLRILKRLKEKERGSAVSSISSFSLSPEKAS